MAWCLLPDLTRKFLDALRKGEIDPEKLAAMSSRRTPRRVRQDPRRRQREGGQLAKFEAKLFAQRPAHRSHELGAQDRRPHRNPRGGTSSLRSIVLTAFSAPTRNSSFLEDLAAKKLGVTVTADEAKTILTLAQKAEQLRAAIVARGGSYAEGWTAESGQEFGLAKAELAKNHRSHEAGRPNQTRPARRYSQHPQVPP